MCAGLSRFSHVQLFVTRWTVARQAPLSPGFSRQELWSGLLCPSPGDLPNPGIETASRMSPALANRFYTTSATCEALICACVLRCSVVSDSLRPHELWSARLLCPWDFSGKNYGVGCHFLLHLCIVHGILLVLDKC